MAYDEYLEERIERIMQMKRANFFTKKMMGGLVFMVNDKMCCGIHLNKKYGDHLLMIRIGEKQYNKEIHKDECLAMDFTGRPMKGYAFISPDGFDMEDDLEYWVELALNFNKELTN